MAPLHPGEVVVELIGLLFAALRQAFPDTDRGHRTIGELDARPERVRRVDREPGVALPKAEAELVHRRSAEQVRVRHRRLPRIAFVRRAEARQVAAHERKAVGRLHVGCLAVADPNRVLGADVEVTAQRPGVEVRGVRRGGHELPVRRARNRVLLHERPRRRIRDAGQLLRGRNARDAGRARATLLHALIVGKPERLVLAVEDLRQQHRTAQREAVFVPLHDVRLAGRVEKRPRIEDVVPQVFKRFPVELVRTVLRDVQHLRARVATVFRAEVVRDDLDFLDRAEIQRVQGATGTGHRHVRRRDAVHRDVVAAAAPTVGVEAARPQKRIVRGHRRHARGDRRENVGVPANRQFLNRLPRHRSLNLSVLGIQQRNRVRHVDRFGHRTDFQVEPHAGDFTRLDLGHSRGYAKARRFRPDFVLSDFQQSEVKVPVTDGSLPLFTSFGVPQCNGCLRHHGASRIVHRTTQVASDLAKDESHLRE